VRLSDLIVRSSGAALAIQSSDGAFPPGRNGPYGDPETPVRNTAHWLVSLLKAYEVSGLDRFREAARRAVEYLASDAARPMRGAFLCRTNPRKDLCNGLIGQAWAIEGLAVAAAALEAPRYAEIAREVFLLHPFDHRPGLWERMNVDGGRIGVDEAFNHQLWFAAAGALASRGGEDPAMGRVRRFLDRTLESHLRVALSGRIRHALPPLTPAAWLRRQAQRARHLPAERRHRVRKEVGYHAFNLYAFALLRRHVPDHALWTSKKLRSALGFVGGSAYRQGLEGNEFGYPYNPPGFEVPFALHVFAAASTDGSATACRWIEEQLRRCYDPVAAMMSRGGADPATLAARLYEATRLDDVELSCPEEAPLQGTAAAGGGR
jgi:hypothetical protein